MRPDNTEARRRWMGVMAKATPDEIAGLWSRIPAIPAYELLRRPETGLVMVRGRTGGDGGAFNLGEMPVTRCSVRLAEGIVGHAWVSGRGKQHAERAAIIDALMQSPPHRAAIESEVAALDELQASRRRQTARKAAATRVDFFTMIRGED